MSDFELAEQRLRRLMNGETKEAIYASDAPAKMQRDIAHTCYVLDMQTVVRGWLAIDRPLVMASKDLLAIAKAVVAGGMSYPKHLRDKAAEAVAKAEGA